METPVRFQVIRRPQFHFVASPTALADVLDGFVADPDKLVNIVAQTMKSDDVAHARNTNAGNSATDSGSDTASADPTLSWSLKSSTEQEICKYQIRMVVGPTDPTAGEAQRRDLKVQVRRARDVLHKLKIHFVQRSILQVLNPSSATGTAGVVKQFYNPLYCRVRVEALYFGDGAAEGNGQASYIFQVPNDQLHFARRILTQPDSFPPCVPCTTPHRSRSQSSQTNDTKRNRSTAWSVSETKPVDGSGEETATMTTISEGSLSGWIASIC